MSIARWLVPSVLPALVFVVIVYRSDVRREPPWLVALTFAFGVLAHFGAHAIEVRAGDWTGLDLRTSVAGNAGAIVFLFAVAAPVREALKVAASWFAFRTRHFDEPYDGLVYSTAAAAGFACSENVMLLRAHPEGWVWIARSLLALPAHLFFAAAWGYALGLARRLARPGRLFPVAWFSATIGHGFYTHFVYGRGAGALVAALPFVIVMGVVTFFAARDLKRRSDAQAEGRLSSWLIRVTGEGGSLSSFSNMGSLLRPNRPVMLRWVMVGMLVTSGAMVVGLAAAIGLGHWAGVDFAIVDEHDASTTGPVALLGAGLLAAFPLSGFLVAKASGMPTLLEPALGAAIAIVATLLLLGFAAPIALVFALAFSPIAWSLSCVGAWLGRPILH